MLKGARAIWYFHPSTFPVPQVKPDDALTPSLLKESEEIQDMPIRTQYFSISAKARLFHRKTQSKRDESIDGAPL